MRRYTFPLLLTCLFGVRALRAEPEAGTAYSAAAPAHTAARGLAESVASSPPAVLIPLPATELVVFEEPRSAIDPVSQPRNKSAPATTPQPLPQLQPQPPLPTTVPPQQLPSSTMPMAPQPGALQMEPITAPDGQPIPEMSLEDFQFVAQTRNPALREASARVGVASGNALQVGLYPNPFFFVSTPQLAGSISQYNAVWCQDFVVAGKLRLNRAAAQREVEQAQLNFTKTRFEVLTNVRVQFYATAAAQQRADKLVELVAVTAKSRDVGQKLLQAGETNRANATLLEIENDKAVVALRNNDATLRAARKQLAAVVGVPESEIGRLKFDFSIPLPKYEHEALRLGVVNQNALAAVAAVEVQRTQWVLRRARVEPYPNFQVQTGFQYGTEAPLHQQGYGQFTMSVPLFNRNQGAIRSAQSDITRATAGLYRVENELSQQTAAALGEFAAADVRSTMYTESILPKARDVLSVNQSLFAAGQSDFLVLLQAQRTLFDLELANIDAQEERWQAAAKIAGLLQLEQFP